MFMRRDMWRNLLLCAVAALLPPAPAQADRTARACVAVTLSGDVKAGQSWEASFGQGWIFRVQPIEPSQAGYSGWDLVVDREQPIGYPDALLLATLPYNSINEREIGTTYGLRAQDAIGWNPRSFRTFVDSTALDQARQTFDSLKKQGALSGSKATGAAVASELARLQELMRHTASGTFTIEDARLTPGIADPPPFAQEWAQMSARVPHQNESPPDGKTTPQGTIQWIRFSVALTLPPDWKLPAGQQGKRVACVP